MTGDTQLVAETKALIAEVEAGETKHAAWIAIQDRVKQLLGKHSQAEVGRLLDKHSKWVSMIEKWDAGSPSAPTPFAGTSPAGKAAKEQSERAAVRRIAREAPEQVAEAIQAAPPEARAEAFKALAADTEGTRNEMLDAGLAATPTPTPRKTPRPTQTWLAILSYLENARRGMERALDELSDQPELPENVAAKLEVETRRVADAAALLIGFIERGSGGGMMDEINDFLAAQAAGSEEDAK